ncbi:MAG TPA: polyprenyl synthetase family protein [Pyrinomonadaceae bacterium]|nr:polyprenyl synthetase family protein [Pyrinomonadaceae bacterium]
MQRFAAAKRELSDNDAMRRVFGLIGPEMKLVEQEFERQAASNIQVINYLGDYVRASGGKRLRPALLILANLATGGDGSSDNVIRLATVMEMLHTATLVHDDIIDNADLRRNRSSINARFGNQTAVLMGDWLYMSAFETSLRERSLEILDILTNLTRKMTEGELIQLTRIGRLDITEDEYLDILLRKTAYLFSACCEIGAILAGANAEVQAAMRDFGLELGIAFQIADDVLDVTADTKTLGKTAGSDLLEGKLTLPLIYLLRENPDIRASLEKIMFDGEYVALTREQIRTMLDEAGVFATISKRLTDSVKHAIKSLDVLPESEYRLCLEDVSSYVTERNK